MDSLITIHVYIMAKYTNLWLSCDLYNKLFNNCYGISLYYLQLYSSKLSMLVTVVCHMQL